jgi:hypothetical protein
LFLPSATQMPHPFHPRHALSSGAASEAAVAAAIQSLLKNLQAAGFVCGWQLVWGELQGGWPPDWYVQSPGLVGEPPAAGSSEEAGGSSGSSSGERQLEHVSFQIKLLQPADIQASVALRSEDDGFWGRHVSSMIM